MIHGLKIEIDNGYTAEPPLQLICDMEIGRERPNISAVLDLEAPEFTRRQNVPRKAKEDAMRQLVTLRSYEDEDEEC